MRASAACLIGARPARFRRVRLLIVGCGDVGSRVVRQLPKAVRVIALTSTPDRTDALRSIGATPVAGNLDDPRSLRRLAGLASHVLHLAPPPSDKPGDPRTRALLRALRRGALPQALVYGSTSGVYGDCGGALVSETRSPRPASTRARRRLDAETTVRGWGRSGNLRATVLRIPGIYAEDRAGGTPRERLVEGTPALVPEADVFTNHIHADDLARACIAALWRARPQRVVNVCDDTDLKMGDYLDLAADRYRLPRPPRILREEAERVLSPLRLSFLSESRRLTNTRLKRELRLALRYPTVESGLAGPPQKLENDSYQRPLH